MRFAVCAGGTAGHVNPALAVAQELSGRGHEIVFFGTPTHIESRLAPEAGFEFVSLDVSGFDKAHPTTLVTSGVKILAASSRARRVMRERHFDAAVTFGAYVSIPVGLAATKLGVPLVVHEQNSMPGMANVFLAQRADVTALTYASSEEHLDPKHPAIVCGNPVRSDFDDASRERGRELFGVPDGAKLLVVTGGSLGAAHLNSAVVAMKKRLLSIEDLHVIHSCGPADYDATCAALALRDKQKGRWQLMPYIDDMASALAAADLVISRAGASSLAEVAAIGVPSVLVPYPYARADHQTANARSLSDAGAAVLVADADLDGPEFTELVCGLVTDRAKLSEMREAAAALGASSARARLADLAEEAAWGGAS